MKYELQNLIQERAEIAKQILYSKLPISLEQAKLQVLQMKEKSTHENKKKRF